MKKRQYHINREEENIYALSASKIDNYEYLSRK